MHWNKIRQYLSDHTYARDNATKHYYMGMILREIVDYLEEEDKVEDPLEKSFEEIAWNLDNHLKEVNTDFQFGDLVRYVNGDYVVQGIVNRRFCDNSVVDSNGFLSLCIDCATYEANEVDVLDVLAVKCRVIRRGE